MFKNHQKNSLVIVLLVVTIGGCSADEPAASTATGRWYTAEQAQHGQELFQIHCASCHGNQAQGLAEDWRKTDADGNYPAPPLNGSAHAWHHPLVVLEKTIAEGGVPLGGVMPGFAQTLDEPDARATIAYFQSLWTDEIYSRWEKTNES